MHPRSEKGGEAVAGPPDGVGRSDADGVEALRPHAAHEFGFQIGPAALHLRHHRIGGPIPQNRQPILVVKSSNIMEIRLAALLISGMGFQRIITAKFKDRPMPLDKLALTCVIVLTALWCGLLVASAVAALPFGLPVLIVLLVIGYFVYRVVRDRIENKEDDYYDKNIKQ
jgi:hypothetical protein